MKIKGFVIALFAAALLTACSGETTNEAISSPENIKEMVHDYSVGNITDESASITSQQLIVTDSDEKQTAYDLPGDEFFVSIAPYIDQTHP